MIVKELERSLRGCEEFARVYVLKGSELEEIDLVIEMPDGKIILSERSDDETKSE